MQCQHLFVLPGVPTYFENGIKRLAAYLPAALSELRQAGDIGLSAEIQSQAATRPDPTPRSDTYRVVLSLEEDAIVTALDASVSAHPHVSFGSYPIVDDPSHKTIITLEGNGVYTKSWHRLSAQYIVERLHEANATFFFSKEEMDQNAARALADIKSRLPEMGIVCIDSCDNLRTWHGRSGCVQSAESIGGS